jgi:hypothetical protein
LKMPIMVLSSLWLSGRPGYGLSPMLSYRMAPRPRSTKE